MELSSILIERLHTASAAAGLTSSALLAQILDQSLAQLEREAPHAGALPIVEELRRARGLGPVDSLSRILEARETAQRMNQIVE